MGGMPHETGAGLHGRVFAWADVGTSRFVAPAPRGTLWADDASGDRDVRKMDKFWPDYVGQFGKIC